MSPNALATAPMVPVLSVNVGSSTIRFALFGGGDTADRALHGKVERIGRSGTSLTFQQGDGERQEGWTQEASDHRSAVEMLIDWMDEHISFATIGAVGHRVVQGMKYTQPTRVTADLMKDLHRECGYDPEHLPLEIEVIKAFCRRYPNLPQVVCFDTAFHCTMPRVARLLPIPRRFDALGIRRYGFHGLSYSFLLEELARVAGPQAARGRVILAHLGGGASLAAVKDGHSVDTSMGFTPASGIPMGTRPGDLDPGVAWYLMKSGNLSPGQFNDLINHECGLLGVSGLSSDMRDLMAHQGSDVRAAEAVELFCYQTRKWIGAFAAVLGGVDTVVFSGGIGENISEIRTRTCQDLQFLGIELDASRNASNSPLISSDSSRVAVRVIRTDEERMIAREVRRMLAGAERSERGALKSKELCNE